MTRTERDAFFKAAQKLSPVRYALMRLAYETASRITEVLHLQWTHVDPTSRTVTINRIKGSKTIVADVSNKLLRALDSYWGDRRRPKKALLFPGTNCCPKRSRGIKRPRKSGMAWEHCPGPHLVRQQINRWVESVGAAIDLEPGLRHPHTFKHTRLCDEARRYKDEGPAAMIAACRRLSGHESDTALLGYLDDPEVLVERVKNTRAEMEQF